jgi:hypothetical protein
MTPLEAIHPSRYTHPTSSMVPAAPERIILDAMLFRSVSPIRHAWMVECGPTDAENIALFAAGKA